jgi:hypothetical protein
LKDVKPINEILGVRYYKDLFNGNADDMKDLFREYCKTYHPDICSQPKAGDAFCIIGDCYRKYLASLKSTTSSDSDEVEMIFKSNSTSTKGFALKNYKIDKIDVGVAVSTANKIAVVFDKSYEKQFNRYIDNVKHLSYADKQMQSEFERYFPNIVKSIELPDSSIAELPNAKYVILLDKSPDVYNLGRIVNNYAKYGKPFPEKQAAWIMNRLYNIACYLNYSGKVCNGLTLSNLWVSPCMHTILLLNGFEHMQDAGTKMISCSPSVFKVMPQPVKDSKLASIATDLESIKSIGKILFKDSLDHLPHINSFLNSGVDFVNPNPIDDWKQYGSALDKEFGKRTFVVWDDFIAD